MCGFVGYVGKKIDKDVLRKMNDRIKHRGPDQEGYYLSKKIGLGHRRLSIIDLDNGKQPIYNEDGSKVIVFNGEIYNYQELREQLVALKHIFSTNSDTEVLIHGYEEWGYDLTKKLRGMFAFAIWDKRKKILFLARDQWGIKPLYYYENNGVFMFGSEIKSFLEHPDFKKEFNERILAAYLCFNSTPTEETFFKGVYRLEPGHQLIYRKGKKKISRFYKLEFKEDSSSEDMVEKIREVMVDSVLHHKISDVEVGSFLSSGVDSSYLVSLAKPDKTYTVGYENAKYDEIGYVKELVDKLGIDNKTRIINKEEYMKAFPKIMYYMDEPLADPSAIALYFVAELASSEVKVVLSGEGADEFFGGYNYYKAELDQSWYSKVPYFIRNGLYRLVSVFPEGRGFNFLYRYGQKLEDYNIGLGRVFRDSEAIGLVKNKDQIKTREIVRSYYEEYKDNSDLVKRQVIDFYFWLVRDFLHAVDRNTMMFGLEARTPFLDKEVFEVASKLSLEEKVNKKTTKVALRKAASEVVPTDAYKKRKLGFPVPLREWIREEDLYKEILRKFEGEVAEKYFETRKIIRLLKEHKNKKKDNYKKVWAIYAFLVWYEQFFEEDYARS